MPPSNVDTLVRDPGYTPSRKHVPRLIELIADEEAHVLAARALVRLGAESVAPVLAAFEGSIAPTRGRLIDLIGDLSKLTPAPEGLRAFLLARLGDDDAKTRRNAVIALAAHEHPEVELALIRYWNTETRPDHRRSVARTLGRVGGERALALLRWAPTEDAELTRASREAVLALERRALRSEESYVSEGSPTPGKVHVVAHCRRGLEAITAEEYPSAWRPRVVGPGRVEVALRTGLSDMFRARTMTRMGFELMPRPINGRDLTELLADVITSDEALGILRSFTQGAIRYRIEWAGAGHRRGATTRCVELVSRQKPFLINDSRESTWEVIALEHNEQLLVELVPKRLDDPRFTYRKAEVPAASQPTLAAALVRVAGVRTDDVVWDPFVGSGVELCERGLAGPYAHMIGGDIDPRALSAARINLDAARIERVSLSLVDALAEPPRGVSLIITNPPLGHRVGFGQDIGALLEGFVAKAAAALGRNGRMVWVTPRPERTERAAHEAGLRITRRIAVVLPGFAAEIHRYER